MYIIIIIINNVYQTRYPPNIPKRGEKGKEKDTLFNTFTHGKMLHQTHAICKAKSSYLHPSEAT